MHVILSFDKMLTPKIITLVYWALLASAVFGGLGMIFGGEFSAGKLFGGIFMTVAGAFGARIFCELMIVLFKMNEALQELRAK